MQLDLPPFTSEQFRCHECGQTGGWVATTNPDGTVGVSVLRGFHPEGSTIACDQCGEHLRATNPEGPVTSHDEKPAHPAAATPKRS